MGRVTTVVILAMLMTFWVIFLKNRPYIVYIMSKDFDYHITSILEVCIDHYEVPSSSSLSYSHYNATINSKALTPPPFSLRNPQALDHHPS